MSKLGAFASYLIFTSEIGILVFAFSTILTLLFPSTFLASSISTLPTVWADLALFAYILVYPFQLGVSVLLFLLFSPPSNILRAQLYFWFASFLTLILGHELRRFDRTHTISLSFKVDKRQ